ncbi:MAG: transposase [Chromatiales bacterium]|nr:MAG: transposase [Chromatiales bacterium]
MGRQRRVFVPGYPHHVVQRGHNRNAVFVEPADYEYYLANLVEWKAHYEVAVYAWCLMTNHVHLVLAPRVEGQPISALMRRLAARQARYVNRLERRIGTLWAGRFKCSIVDSDEYLLACLRYVELNPVRAGICRHPADYPWSSYRQRVGLPGEHGGRAWLDADPVTTGLGETAAARATAYAKFVAAEIPEGQSARIRAAVQRNQLTGGRRFVDEIERRTGVRIESRGQGRPAGKCGK